MIGQIGKIFGDQKVSIESIMQFDANDNVAEIVVITHKVTKGQISNALSSITNLSEVKNLDSHLSCL